MRLNYFANDKHKLLDYLYKNAYKRDVGLFYRGNQQRIADHIHFSKGKVNALMQDLCKNNFIELKNKRMGLYEIKDTTIDVLNKFKEEI